MQEQNATETGSETDSKAKASNVITSYADFCDDDAKLTLLKEAGLEKPSKAFAQAAPVIAAGKNILIEYSECADRAALFAIPLMTRSSDDLVIVFAGTETAANNISDLLKKLGISSAVVSAGQSLPKEAGNARAIIGTPAAVTELSESPQWPKSAKISTIVIDGLDNAPTALHSEATPAELIGSFLEKRVTTENCQFIWAAASEPLIFRSLLNTYLRENSAESFSLDQDEESNVQHLYVEVGSDLTAKPNALCDLLEAYSLPNSIIYCNSPSDADLVDVLLKKRGIKAFKLIGHVPGHKITSAIADVLEGNATALVVTDISGRAINVEDFEMIVNHSIHSDPEVYIHRIGTPGSASALKRVVSVVGPTDLAHFHYIKKLFEFEFSPAELPSETELLQKKILGLAEESPEGYVKDKYLELAKQVLEGEKTEDIVALLLFNTLEALPASKSRGNRGRRDRNDRNDRNDRGDRGRDRDRGDRDSRDRGRGRDDRNDRGDRRNDRRDNRRDDRDSRQREPQLPPKKDVRLYIGHGSKAGFSESKLEEILKGAVDESGAPAKPERISVRSLYTFVDFPEESAESILKQLESKEVASGEPMVVYKATMISTPRKEVSDDSDDGAATKSNGHAKAEEGETAEKAPEKAAEASAEEAAPAAK